MRKLFHIEDTLANKISFYHLLLLLVSLPFDFFYSHIILISFCLHTLIHFKKANVKPFLTWRTLLLQSVFILTLIGSTYTSYQNQAFTDLGRQVVILIFPIAFFLNPLNLNKYRAQLLLGFSVCCTATVAYLYLDALLVIRYYHMPFKTLFSRLFTNHNFSEPIGMHATFFSLQIGVALVYLFTVWVKQTERKQKIFYAVCCAVLAAGLIQLSSKSVFLIAFIMVNFLLPLYLMNGRRRVIFLTTSFAISILIIIAIFKVGAFKERYLSSFSNDLSRKPLNEVVDSRLSRWRVSFGLIRQKPIIGYGSGSEMALLRESFYQHKLYDSFLNRLNSHNEYLSLWLNGGIGALLVYVLTLAYGFKKSIDTKDIIFFTFMMLIAIVSLSENIFDVDKGTMFYGFFFSFFIFSNQQKNIERQHFTNKNILTNGQPVPEFARVDYSSIV